MHYIYLFNKLLGLPVLCPTAIIRTMVQKAALPDEGFTHSVPALSLLGAQRKKQPYEKATIYIMCIPS